MTNDVTPAALRAAATKALEGPGKRYRRLLTQLEQAKEDLRPVIREAVRMEVPIKEISRVTGLSRNTIAAWIRDDSE